MDDLSDHMKIKNIALYYIAQIKIVLTCFKVIDLYRKKITLTKILQQGLIKYRLFFVSTVFINY
jgi:hypothetical protein